MISPAAADLTLTDSERHFLYQFAFNAEAFLRLKSMLSNGSFPPERNQLTAPFSHIQRDFLQSWPKQGEAESIGQKAIENGEVGVAILNGGMATRFGGIVKGVVQVFDTKSFLELKIRDIQRAQGRVPTFVMNSFATHTDTITHVKANQSYGLPESDLHFLVQRISLRLTPDGEIFRLADGSPSFYAPGHGDIFDVLAQSEAFHKEQANGMKYLLISNVDNLAANLNPKVIGAHITGGKSLTVEVANRKAGDKGGAPACVNGRVEIVEGFRFPDEFNQDSLAVFNTNTFTINSQIIGKEYPLDWFRADKQVQDTPVVQFERLMGQITHFIDANYLLVPRQGAESRFMPIKTPADLERLRPQIQNQFG